MVDVQTPFNKLPEVPDTNLSDFTLILPSVSIGNIPQFTVDLFLHNYDFKKLGSLDDTYLYPFVSPVDRVDGKRVKGISNAIEVFYDPNVKLCLIQQRPPVIPNFYNAFIDEVILPFIKIHDFKKIVLLDSSDAGVLEKSQVNSIALHTNKDLLSMTMEKLQISDQGTIETEFSCHSRYITSLVKALSKNNIFSKVEIQAIVMHVYEGDNLWDSEKLANFLNETLKLEHKRTWQRPISWKGVYGDRPVPVSMEEGIFG